MYLLIGVSIQNNVAIFMNKYELAKKINELEGLTMMRNRSCFSFFVRRKSMVWFGKTNLRI